MTNLVLKIALTGPESSGKTTLAAALAAHFHSVWVPEFARFYVAHLGKPYQQTDLAHIAAGQKAWESWYAPRAQGFLFCDTDLTVLQIWHKVRYKTENPAFATALAAAPADLYFLTAPDFPWQADPLREHPAPEQRADLFECYKTLLESQNLPFVLLEGSFDTRMTRALQALSAF